MKVNKSPEETPEEKKEKDDELAKNKKLLFVAKNNLAKVDKALKVATVAVKNEETVVSTAKNVAHVQVKEPKKVSASKIEDKIEASEAKVAEDPMVQEAKEPKSNEERDEENTSQAVSIAHEKPAESEAGDEEPEVE